MNSSIKDSSLITYLISEGLITELEVDLAQKEHAVTEEDLPMILVRNGFVRQTDLVSAILHAEPELIYDDFAIIPGIPSQLLIDTRTIIVAETQDRIFLSTLDSEEYVKSEIEKYDPRSIQCVPMNISRLDEYIDEMTRNVSNDDEDLADRLLRRALNHRVSDLHIFPREKSYTILQRRDGIREWCHEGDLDEYHVLVARIKDRAKMDLQERRVPQDGSFQVEHHKRMVDMRVATTPSVKGEYVVIRLLDPDSIMPNLNKSGITRVNEWRKGINRANGLCLICGPTGSGKTTTLNSSVRELDRIGKAVFTIEDPVEYLAPFVGQVNVNTAVGLDFARGQKAFMRQDPDIIITGEIRDEETARISIKGAETGHVMVATLHTSSAHGAVNRLRDLGIPAHELRSILRTVLAQRLIRVYCTACGGIGCGKCNHTGYSGRTIVSECVYFEDEDAFDRMLEGHRHWPSMVEDAVQKAKDGITSKAEVIRVFGPEGEAAFEKAAATNANPEALLEAVDDE